MTDFDLSLDGADNLTRKFAEVKQRGEGDRVDVVGTNQEYAVILEFGRGPVEAPEGSALKFEVDGETIFRKKVSGHPPYPFFRPAIREFKANPEKFILDNTDYPSIDAIPTANALVNAVSSALERQMKNNASADRSADRSPGTHPEHPKRDTGALVASIQAVRVK